jgi:arylsulfatase A-like enzyme
MMTGVYPSAHGLRWNIRPPSKTDRPSEFRSGQMFYSHYLSRAGYRNAYVGKWHCGYERIPANIGMEGWSLSGYGCPYTSDAYREYASERGLGEPRALLEHSLYLPDREGTILAIDERRPWGDMGSSGVLQGPPEAHEQFFVTHMVVEKLKELARSDQSWSLVASYWGPHQPYYPTEPYASMIDPRTIPEYPSFRDELEGRPLRNLILRDFTRSRRYWPEWSAWQEILARCYGQALQLDDAIGRLLAALDELGLSEDTIVIWTADHGDTIASHGGCWDKGDDYREELARVPMAVRWPADFPGGIRTNALVSNMDATATMLDAAGVDVPGDMHSRSMLPLCRDPAMTDWPDQLICEHDGVRGGITQRIILTDRYKYAACLYGMDELYDLREDPFEMKNLVDDPAHTDVKADLRQRLIDHIETTNDPAAQPWLLHALKLGR